MRTVLSLLLVTILLAGCNQAASRDAKLQSEVDSFLIDYSKTFQELRYEASKADWALNTRIVEGDTLTSQRAEATNEALAGFTGSQENILTAMGFLDQKDQLTDLQIRQLDAILYVAANNPAIAEDIVSEKIKTETEQVKNLFGYDFQIDSQSVSANELDAILSNSTALNKRLAVWEASKEVGVGLKEGLEKLRGLRNRSVQALDYENYFQYQVSEYGMNSEDMLDLNRRLISEIWPLYRELHTWARYELAAKYGQEVPEMLPAHWLPNRWGQNWSAIADVQGLNFDKALEGKGSEWIVRQGEDFYLSLGYDSLPETFYSKSSLYPLPHDAGYRKNNHASAWHLNLDNDLRSLMSVEPNMHWWNTVLHELGHIYYFQAYSTDSIPLLLRSGANRAYHEAIGTLIGLASMQRPFLVEKGLIDPVGEPDNVQGLLNEALDYIVFMPWASGVMTHFEYSLYAEDLPRDQFNEKWWALKQKYQGIVPPGDRSEEFCDACSKTHISNDAAQYYDYALANVLLFQFHMHIAKNILQQDPHESNYYGSEEAGEFLLDLMSPGATQDWRENLQENLDEEISAAAIQEYFEPLMAWLVKENQGRVHTLPETINE